MTMTEMWRWGYPGDWVILWTGLSWGWYNQSDWEDWIVRRGRWLVMVTTWGIHVICWNMNEHGYFLMFSVDGVMKYTYKPSM